MERFHRVRGGAGGEEVDARLCDLPHVLDRHSPGRFRQRAALADGNTLQRLGVQPHEAFAIEDSPHGVTAAKAAGLRCIAAPNPLTAGMDLRHADYVLPSMASVSLAEVVAGLVV